MIYLSGPMTGIKDLNFPAFNALASALRAKGFGVINPADIKPDPSAKWSDCMKRDICELMQCDTIFMMRGWEKSRGATLEKHIADALGYCVIYEKELDSDADQPVPSQVR